MLATMILLWVVNLERIKVAPAGDKARGSPFLEAVDERFLGLGGARGNFQLRQEHRRRQKHISAG
jgi:hypothetical protein